MDSWKAASAGIVLVASALAFAGDTGGIAETRTGPPVAAKISKILVLGISDDREIRHRFEDKLVTHLRGREVAALTSYSLVEDLTKPGDRDQILAALEREKVDAVLSVRAVPMDDTNEAGWAKAWSAWSESPATLRELVERSVPVPKTAAKRYGAEITLWEIRSGSRPWSARTAVYERKKLREAAAGLMQDTITRLRELEIL